MTIKQQGGIFGRNPTFNNVTVDGSLSGLSNLSISGNLIVASGQGMDFSATSGTGTSELFDDYEEGTWTPTYAPTTGSFTTMTYNNQQGYYTKIGDLVYINCLISTSNSNPTGGSGVLLISGLPYTCGASADHSLAVSATINWGGDYPLAGQVIESSSTIKFQYRTAVNGEASSLDVSDMATSTSSNRNYIRFSGCYKV